MSDSNALEAAMSLADLAAEGPSHSCGYPEGTFACRIRHIQLNTGDAKAARD